MTWPAPTDREPPTTDGTIAVANLHAQISGLAVRVSLTGSAQAADGVADRAALINLLLLRGGVLGRIADYERAAELAGQFVRDAPGSATAWLARTRTHAIFHRVGEALNDLDTARRLGCEQATLNVERAAILQAAGCYWHALVLCMSEARQRPSFTTMGALAVLQGEHGEVAAAESQFAEARRRYRGISPFPVASLDYRRGLMWQGQGNVPAARAWFRAAQRRVPAYAPALGHLAQVDAALGAGEDAIARLRPLASSSDDPQYAADLAHILAAVGHPREARRWRFRAAARYTELTVRHPRAFARHATVFRRQAEDMPDTHPDYRLSRHRHGIDSAGSASGAGSPQSTAADARLPGSGHTADMSIQGDLQRPVLVSRPRRRRSLARAAPATVAEPSSCGSSSRLCDDRSSSLR